MPFFQTTLRAFLFLSLLAHGAFQLQGQALQGHVRDDDGTPIPFATLYFTDLASGTAADENGAFFMKLPHRGDFRLITSAIGYQSRTDTLIVGDRIESFDLTLLTNRAELEEIVIRASRRDPAYAIMAAAADHRKDRLQSLNSYRVQVYLKAREDVAKLDSNKQKRKKSSLDLSADAEAETFDPQEAKHKEKMDLLGKINLLESRFTLNYLAPRYYKEQRTAYKISGNREGLLLPLFGDGDFNFYRSQVDFGSLADVAMISPLAPTAVLSYKFKLLATRAEGSELVHEIAIISRRSGSASLEGTIWINEGSFAINRLDVTLPKAGLRLLDELRFEQSYGLFRDSIWLPVHQRFTYKTKLGKRKLYSGQTTLRFHGYELDFPLEPGFFRGELAITEAAAYKRDSSYWNAARPEPLADDEATVLYLRDSIQARISSPAYQDSLQAAYNRVKLLDVAWDGVGFRRHRRREHIYFGPLPSWLGFTIVGGFRVGPFVQYTRTFPNGQRIISSLNASVGVSNQDLQGAVSTSFRYAPKKLATVWMDIDRGYEAINPFDAFLNQLRRSNYFLVNRVRGGHSFEISNGLYLDTEASFAQRLPAPSFGTKTFLENIIEDEEPIEFQPYEAFATEIALRFTPYQQYLSEPNQKIVLGSKWPTFTLRHKRGWLELFNSDVSYDYLELSLSQNLLLGPLGNTRYQADFGQFISSERLPFVDLRRFRQCDPILFSPPLRSFQLLDTSLATTRPFLQAHSIHHFNGAFLNNLPLLRLTGIEFVVGAGFLYLTENNFRHEEVFGGVERTFKLGARRRLRLGVYGVLANSSRFRGDQTFKVSLDIIDTWKKDWSF